MEDYRDIQNLLKPKHTVKASSDLRRKVRMAMDESRLRRKRVLGNWIMGGLSTVAVASLLIFMLIPSGMSASSTRDILLESINVLSGINAFEMNLAIRTNPNDNFHNIDISTEFVSHRLYVEKTDSTTNWFIEKNGRAGMQVGKNKYMWINNLKMGYRSDNSEWDVLGYLSVFLSPSRILEGELEKIGSVDDDSYDVQNAGDDIILTVHALPRGDFANPYMLNSSVEESESVRRYVIDAKSRLLKSASVCIVSGGKEQEIIRVDNIRYAVTSKDIFRLPDSISFYELEADSTEGIAAEDPRDAAVAIFNAFHSWDLDILGKVTEDEELSYLKPIYIGCEIVSVGQPFHSGNGTKLTYVPYKLRLKTGEIRNMNISLSKNSSGRWIMEGGL